MLIPSLASPCSSMKLLASLSRTASMTLSGCLFLGTVLPGQVRLFSHAGEQAGDGYGRAICFVGDVDGDGIPDLLIGATNYVQIRSGSHGGLLRRVAAKTLDEGFGSVVLGPGDLDGDRRADFLVAAPLGGAKEQGRVTAYSGKTGKVLYEVLGDRKGDRFGSALCRLVDLDGDGTPEFGVGAPMHDNIGIDAGMIRIYSGKTGKPLFYYTGTKAGGGFGSALTAIGDLDADGVDDLLIGAGKGAYASIYSAKKARLLRMIQGPLASGFGSVVMRSDDLNQDKIGDYWISAPEETSKGQGKGTLRLYSGKTSKLLRTLYGPKAMRTMRQLKVPSGSSAFGWVLSPAGDVDKDGSDDILVGDPFASAGSLNSGRVQLYSGKTGLVLSTWTGKAAGNLLGNEVMGRIDFDGDRTPDIAISSYSTGRVQIYSGKSKLLLKTLTGITKDGFGSSLLHYQHTDAGRWPDVLVASPFFDGFRGKIELFSSQSGKAWKTWKGTSKGDFFGTAMAVLPDRDGDGLPELLVGSPSHAQSLGRAQIRSSKTGASLLEIRGSLAGDRLGAQVLSPGDLDGDGEADLIVSAPGAARGLGEVRAFSGRDGGEIYKVVGKVAGGRMGTSLSLLADLDGDGLPEWLAGAPTDSSAAKLGPGSLSIHSGGSGRWLIQESGSGASQALGADVVAAGDLDGDGREDLAVSSLGGKGALAFYHADPPDSGFATVLHSLADQNADGLPETLIALPGHGRILIRSGKNGALLSSLSPKDRSWGFGRSLYLADLNVDGAQELAVGGDAAGVDIYSLRSPAFLADPGTLPVSKGGFQAWQISAGKSHAGKLYMVLGSLSGVSPGVRLGSLLIPLNPDAYTSFSLTWPNQAPFLWSRGFLDLAGKAQAGLLLPPLDASLKGLVFHHAFVVLGFSFRFEFASNPVPLLLR